MNASTGNSLRLIRHRVILNHVCIIKRTDGLYQDTASYNEFMS